MARLKRPSWPTALGVLAVAALWALAAHLLWDSTMVPSQQLPGLDPHRFFSDSFLHRSAHFELFLGIEQVVATLVLVAVLVVYARRGQRLIRESAAGRVGTGLLLAMMGFAIVWLAEAPFEMISLWWLRRHGVSHQGYLESLVGGFLNLGSEFTFICIGFAIMMGLAGVLKRWWWLLAVPAFVALGLLSSFVSPYLLPNTRPVENPTLKAEARSLEDKEGAPHARLRVQEVHTYTDAPNAESLGLGPTSTIVLWDTLLDNRFDGKEVRFVLGHEVGHLAHHDPLKSLGWLGLFLLPALGLTALFTRRRGGLAQPEAVPVALLVLIVVQLLATPLLNLTSRRQEASADWAALNATREPGTDRAVMRNLSTSSLGNPEPPFWITALDGDHPTTMERIAMAQLWEEQR